MKKYIILISLCSFAFFQIKADVRAVSQDSIKKVVKGFKFQCDELENRLQQMEFDFDTEVFGDIDIDSFKMQTMDNSLKDWFQGVKSNLRDMKSDINQNTRIYVYNDKGNKDKTPTRIEKKKFSNISEIEFFHSYGNIIVRESSSKQVELEIHYFDTKNQQASCKITEVNKYLTITTSRLSKNSSGVKINYIISIPRDTRLDVELKYGDMKMDRFTGAFNANLSYSNLSAQNFATISPAIKMKYCDLKIEEVKEADISASYSNIRIKKADKIEVTGNYNDYVFEDVKTLITGDNSSYGDIRVNSLGYLEGKLKYTDVFIGNLSEGMDITTAYGDINVKNVSSKLKNINIKASYSDIYVTIPQDLSVSFDTNIIYGDLSISKKHNVKYTESVEKNNRTIKKGQIGTKKSTATIVVTNSYADLTIR